MSAWVSYNNLTKFKGKLDELYGASLEVTGQTVKLISKAGEVIATGTVAVPSVSDVTTTTNGLMLASDKVKLDGIAQGATKVQGSGTNGSILINGASTKVYTHPTATAHDSGLYKIQVDGSGHVVAVTAVGKADITALGIPSENTTYSAVTTSNNGLMLATDKSKLNTIAENAQVNVLETVKVNGTALAVNSKSVNIDLTGYALKSDVVQAIKHKGSVQLYSDLPTSPSVGDMYDVKTADASKGVKAGDNVVWTGTEWDNFGGIFSITEVTDAQIDALFN